MIDRQTNYKQKDKNRQIDKLQTDKQIDKLQADKEMLDRYTDTQTDRQIIYSLQMEK